MFVVSSADSSDAAPHGWGVQYAVVVLSNSYLADPEGQLELKEIRTRIVGGYGGPLKVGRPRQASPPPGQPSPRPWLPISGGGRKASS